ncbi:hypothetical protein AYI70_g5227 [Smittium culicis]|uniref:Uncharacterized protein n=1 Tax=Smittium culicis TaxID=133412 RepID=A0A1R1XVL8_9FUNG|nr:hypothetical protein AYI70_g5227 [Smittium culicis]
MYRLGIARLLRPATSFSTIPRLLSTPRALPKELLFSAPRSLHISAHTRKRPDPHNCTYPDEFHDCTAETDGNFCAQEHEYSPEELPDTSFDATTSDGSSTSEDPATAARKSTRPAAAPSSSTGPPEPSSRSVLNPSPSPLSSPFYHLPLLHFLTFLPYIFSVPGNEITAREQENSEEAAAHQTRRADQQSALENRRQDR